MVTVASLGNGKRSQINWNRSARLGSWACCRRTHSSTYVSEAQSWWSRRGPSPPVQLPRGILIVTPPAGPNREVTVAPTQRGGKDGLVPGARSVPGQIATQDGARPF